MSRGSDLRDVSTGVWLKSLLISHITWTLRYNKREIQLSKNYNKNACSEHH